MKMHLKNPHFYLMLLGDAIVFTGALVLAYLFRFEFSLDAFFAQQLRRIWIPILLVKLCTFFLFGLYKGMWRYTSTRDFWRLLQASATSTLLIMAFIFIFYRFEGGYSRAIFLMDGGLTFLFTGALRMVIRSFYDAGTGEPGRLFPCHPAETNSHRRRRIRGREDPPGDHRERSSPLLGGRFHR
jgi:FlaA1/EpsC-like NDP-sugar epimerase